MSIINILIHIIKKFQHIYKIKIHSNIINNDMHSLLTIKYKSSNVANQTCSFVSSLIHQTSTQTRCKKAYFMNTIILFLQMKHDGKLNEVWCEYSFQ